jgi:hypothetical protein
MSFEAKRLRVQLPCEPGGTVREIDVGCPFPTDVCLGGTCWFQTPICRHFVSPVTCDYVGTIVACAHFATPICQFPSCNFGTCRFATCEFGTCQFGTCGIRTFVGCRPGTELEVDPGTILVDPEHLPVLREQLEAQLKEIEKAEEELKKHREANE